MSLTLNGDAITPKYGELGGVPFGRIVYNGTLVYDPSANNSGKFVVIDTNDNIQEINEGVVTTAVNVDWSNALSYDTLGYYIKQILSFPQLQGASSGKYFTISSLCKGQKYLEKVILSDFTKNSGMTGYGVFQGCTALTEVDFGSAVYRPNEEYNTWTGCSNLVKIKWNFDGELTEQFRAKPSTLTTVEGTMVNLGKAFSSAKTIDLTAAPLTAPSAQLYIGGLYDHATAGTAFTPTINFSATTITALRSVGQTLAEITAKGWATNYTES